MVNGVFVENIPLMKVVVGWGQSVKAPFFVLDTGFTGDLQVTQKIAKELGLEVVGVTKTQIANGQVKATVDCKYRTVALERMT
ncbi:MAG: hypothetical protein AAB723_00375 [Patescibacteria group bacterium]